MSFDKATRNTLAKMVSECRRLLIGDIRDQLQRVYGLQPDGTDLPVESLGHLDERGKQAAVELREWHEHLASTEPGQEAERRATAFDRLAHETAFTALNRLAALRLCEERGHVIECVRRGMESDGFKLFERLSGGALGSMATTYQAFLEKMFDELAVDLRVLFDRRAPQSLVFPSERCLEQLLAILNDPSLVHVWQDDETIGWIYQYFNPREEREAMRKTGAPRNSRELAVRNQFFTPRYVVEFLTDNTLGRIWHEMRHGHTRLTSACRYLVCRPKEIFLEQGEVPVEEDRQSQDVRQDDALTPVYIRFRSTKDPRDLTVLDPACGSGHFLLYAFDLLEVIYEEAWNDDQSPPSEASGSALRDDYPDLDSLRREIPSLILRHNLYGIEIDPRCCQIAALALWLRVQRSYKTLGLTSAERPQITRSNIVCAEPMPGENELLAEFVADLKPPLLAQLVRTVFEKMKLAGEAGSLLRIEEEIRGAITEARKQWAAGPAPEQLLLLPGIRKRRTEQLGLFNISGISEEAFWDRAEARVIDALREYAGRAANGREYRRRLFADDAVEGFAFVDIYRERFDVILMNPPFGETSAAIRVLLKRYGLKESHDIFELFYKRAFECAGPDARIGAITPRTLLYQGRFQGLRSVFLNGEIRLEIVIEFDLGVLDGATVRPALFVCEKRNSHSYEIAYSDLRECSDWDVDLLDASSRLSSGTLGYADTLHSVSRFRHFPERRLSLWAPDQVLALFEKGKDLEPNYGKVTQGLSCDDDTRFLRCWWEVPTSGKAWKTFGKYDARSTFVTDFSVVIDWSPGSYELLGSLSNRRANEALYYRPGVAFTRSCEVGMAASVLPADVVFSTVSRYFLPTRGPVFGYLGFLNTKVVEGLHVVLTPDRDRVSGTLRRIPVFVTEKTLEELAPLAENIWRMKMRLLALDETQRAYTSVLSFCSSLDHLALLRDAANSTHEAVNQLQEDIESRVVRDFPIAPADARALYARVESRAGEPDVVTWHNPIYSMQGGAAAIAGAAIGCCFGRWDIRFAIGERTPAELLDAFAPLPTYPPGMLLNDEGLPLTKEDIRRARATGKPVYPLEVSLDGILVEDPGHPLDIEARTRKVLQVVWRDRAEVIEREMCEILDVRTLREYLQKPSAFFADHLKRYSKSRRQAPIYWPLSTASGSYTIWTYCHRVSDESLYMMVNDYVIPKIAETERRLNQVEDTLQNASGRDASRLREHFESSRSLLDELKDFKAELLRVAALPYKPNLNDGVLVTAAPLWALFRLPKWRRDLEECWKELQAGEYDWAHLAYSIWPERVREKCKTDRSLATAHGLEELCEISSLQSAPTKRPRAASKMSRARQMSTQEIETEDTDE